jgi:hypothetical protein
MILDDKYRLDSGISNSMIKEFLNSGPKGFFDKYFDPLRIEGIELGTEGTDIGDLTDCMLTTPELFSKYYYISSDVDASATIRHILDVARNNAMKAVIEMGLDPQRALTHPSVTNPEQAGSYILAAARGYRDPKKSPEEQLKGYQGNWKDETLVNNIIKEGGNYYKDLTIAAGRRVIDQSLFNIAESKRHEALEHEQIGPWLKEKSAGKVEVLFQHMVTAIIKGIKCKILLDYCRIDHTTKHITPKDVKTARSRSQFITNYTNFGYANQGSFYTGVLQHAFPGYTIDPFEFIVLCTDSKEDPMVYRMSATELDITRDGAALRSGKTVVGWMNVLDLIKWHQDNDKWRYPKEYYEKGFVTLNTYNEDAVETLNSTTDEIF